MKKKYRYIVLMLLTIIFVSCATARQQTGQLKDVSPFDYGLARAKTGIERYNVLLKTHQAAVSGGVNVDYSGIDTIKLEIPAKAEQIPLTYYNDFNGCVFVIKNTARHFYLFKFLNEGRSIKIDKRSIDVGEYRKYKELNRGRALLIIEDENLWVDNRKGYSYGHTRKDIQLIENRVARNEVVMPYNNKYSRPQCKFLSLDDTPLVVKDISINRSQECLYVTHIFQIEGWDNVRISNVIINTPENKLHGDHAISISNCTNVTFDNVHIEGTYSHENGYGYGISLNNVWNFKATKLYGNGKWGVFGNNNVNNVTIEDSKINRFDIHCYGRDMSFKNVEFFDLYNQYSSVYGTIKYDNCTFTDFIPVLNGGSYNSFVGHEVIMTDCTMNASPGKNVLFKFSRLNERPNTRHELSQKCLPNVKIKGLNVNLKGGADVFYLFWSSASGENISGMDGISEILIEGLTINQDVEKQFKELILSNINVQSVQPINCEIRDVKVNEASVETKVTKGNHQIRLKTNINVKGGRVRLNNANALKQ